MDFGFFPQGKFVDTWNIKLDHLEWNGLGNIGFDNDENAYIATFKNSKKKLKSFKLVRSHYHIIKVKPEGTIERTIFRSINNNSVYFPGQGWITIPFHNEVQFDIHDNLLAVTEFHQNFIQVFSPDGKLVKKLVLPYEKEKVQEEDIDDWEKSMLENRHIRQRIREGTCDLKFWKKNMPFPEYKPVTTGISFDKRGNLLVLKLSGYGMEGKDRVWYKINIETGNVTTHNFGKNDRFLAVDRDYFYMFKYNEDEEPVTFRLNRKKISF